MHVLEEATVDEVRRVIMNSPNKSCELDPIPTWLLKTCIDELLPLITALINKSLSTGTFPDYFKKTMIRPLLKKPNLDVDALKSYRPVSNLHFVLSLIEKIVMVRLERHIVHNDLHEATQSATQHTRITT